MRGKDEMVAALISDRIPLENSLLKLSSDKTCKFRKYREKLWPINPQ